MKLISFIIPSAPNRDHSEVLTNLQEIHSSHYQDKYNFEILIIKGTWPSSQRNLGIQEATGDLVFFFDDDIIIPAPSIEQAIQTLTEKNAAALGGPNLTPTENSFLQKCFGYILSSPFTMADNHCRYWPVGETREVDENKIISCNNLLTAQAAKENLYNETMFHNEENEWYSRIKQNSGKLYYDPEFQIYHHRRPTLRKFCRQIFNWGQGRGNHIKIAPKNFKLKFLTPLFFLIYLITLPPILYFFPPQLTPSISNSLISTLYLSPLLIYIILNLYFTLESAIRHKDWKSIFITSWLMPLTHILYALGTIKGLLSHKVPEFDPSSFKIIKIDL